MTARNGWILVLVLGVPALGWAEPEDGAAERPVEKTLAGVIHYLDGTILSCEFDAKTIELETPYGILHIPLRDIVSIEAGLHVPEGVGVRATALVADLGADDYTRREQASEALSEIGRPAIPALLEAIEDENAERQDRAERILAEIRQTWPPEGDRDRVVTETLEYVGTIRNPTLPIRSRFGEIRLHLAEIDRMSVHIAGDDRMAWGFERGLTGWREESNNATRWHVWQGSAPEGRACITCSVPGTSQYTDATIATIASPVVNLAALRAPVLKFKHMTQVENGVDYVDVEFVNANGGAQTLTRLNHVDSWQEVEFALPAGARGQILFRFVTDRSVTSTGPFIDDIRIVERGR